MIKIKVDDYDSFSQALIRFKIKCQQTGLMKDIKRHKEWVPKTERKRGKRARAIGREKRKMRKLERRKQF